MTIRIVNKQKLKSLKGDLTRPTSSRVRQVLFEVTKDRLPGSRWLDLCCGFGTVGAEALARGAAFVAGVEAHLPACRLAEENWLTVSGDASRYRVMKGAVESSFNRLAGLAPFDVIYFDPPYRSGLYDAVLPRLASLLADDGLAVVEHHKKAALPAAEGLEPVKTYRSGDTCLSVFTKTPPR